MSGEFGGNDAGFGWVGGADTSSMCEFVRTRAVDPGIAFFHSPLIQQRDIASKYSMHLG